MCSITDPRLARIGTAIDELAEAVRAEAAGTPEPPEPRGRPEPRGGQERRGGRDPEVAAGQHAGHDGGAGGRHLGDGRGPRPGPGPAAVPVHRPDRTCQGPASTTDRRVPSATAHGGQAEPGGVRPGGRPGGQASATSTLRVAVTSGCSRTVTWCRPTVRIGVAISMRRRSSSGPPDARTASAMSEALTEPNSRPAAPARTLICTVRADSSPGRRPGVVQAADVPGRPGPPDQVDLLLGAPGPAHGQAARDQVVASVTALDLDHVTRLTKAGDLVGEDQFHRCAH